MARTPIASSSSVAGRGGAIDEPVLAVGLDRRDAGGARERVPAVRRADPEHVVVEVAGDLLADDGAAERHVPGGDAFRKGHDVGYDALVVRAEPLPSPAEAGHDLVEHEEDPVFVAELAQALQVAVGRNEDAGRAGYRLDEDRRDVLGALVPDHLFDMRKRLLHIAAEDRAVRVRVEEVHHAGDPGLGGPAAVVAAQRHRPLRLPVERAPLREDLVPLGEEAGDLDGVLVRLAAARREDGLRQVAGRYLREQAREGGAALLPERGRDVARALGLLLNGPHHFRVAVTEVDIDETRGEIEDPALARVEPGALGAGDDDL